MADVIKKTTNRFTKGMILDFSPENTENKVLTHALNATLLTFNGNELSLQNDMGNSRVESAYLPDGYIPVGTCEYGGIIYIVSYNPLEDKSQIGCFPSPERVISRDELGLEEVCITKDFFQEIDKGIITGKINHNTQYVLLKNSNLNPGDKFIIYADNIQNEKLKDLYYKSQPVSNPVIALNVVSIEDSGKIVYLNNTVKQYSKGDYSYHILQSQLDKNNKFTEINTDIDSYRDVLNSGYNVFRSKTSGKLAILAELIMIDSYSVTHRLELHKDASNKIKEGIFDIILHTEVTPEITKENYRTVPKLQYYYLKNSQGYLQTGTETITLFNNNIINNSINSTKLSALYEPIDSNISNDLETTLNTSDFKFPKASTYHSILKNYEGNFNEITNEIYTKFIKDKYHRIDITQIKDEQYFISKEAKFYYYNEFADSYLLFTEDTLIDKYEYYIKHNNNIYNDVKRDTKYQGQILYKIKNEIRNADTSIIEDPQIEKYKEQKIYIYREATSSDINQKLYYTTDGGHTYNELVGDKESGITYYTLTVESNYVSVGNVINNPTGIYYYYPGTTDYIEASYEEIIDYFDFTKFPYQQEAPYGSPLTLYYTTVEEVYERASEENLKDFNKPGMVLYYKTNYFLIPNLEDYNKDNQVFILFKNNTLIPLDKFKPHTDYNYINGNTVNQVYPNESPIYVYTTEWGESQNTESITYEDVVLATIKLPDVVVNNALDLPFKYDYTIVPCMNYGRLDHLAISNTVDFSKLHAFNQSNFTTWKYRIEDNQLRLTFGADVYDTYEDDQVDGLILEFYDCQGFAGSLEIVDKKSYSGVFTKIIPLNSLNALSKKRIYKEGDNQVQKEIYSRNINMPLDYDGWDPKVGWSEESLKEGLKNSSLKIYNDCGTLYSNILYGVKTFLRRTKKISNNEFKQEFIQKKNFFLYTLPIYNDYYFTVNDFTNLTYPELNFIMTYKLKDASSKSVFTNNTINNGYTDSDKSIIDSYLGGFYRGKSLEITKYYKYEGTTDLYLEIGLEKSYENLNISYDPNINSIFGCTLKLISDYDINNPITVSSDMEGLTGDSVILNYKDLINSDVNVLNFENADANLYQKTVESLSNHMFINTQENVVYEPIKINYEFVVGYNASITDITDTQVQVTTVCALCHKQQDTEQYNYEDFGVYESDGKFLSSVMFYNEGTSKEEIFGICKQINTEGTMIEQCSKGPNVATESQKITTAGKLNTGEPLKQLINNIGKLTFCQPHAHGLSDKINGVNIRKTDKTGVLAIEPSHNGWKDDGDYDDSIGIKPRSYLFETPKYNLIVNTKNTILYNDPFISTLDYNIVNGYRTYQDLTDKKHYFDASTTDSMREFTGLTGEQLEVFNRKLVETFKNIYAYNPDYDSLTVNKGNVSLQNYNPNFSTNIISTDSVIIYPEKTTLNDYIYLGPVKFSDYLNKLESRSNIKVKNNDVFIPQVQLTENLQYCGVKGSNYLISSLTYNTPVPFEIEQELEFSASNLTVVKHQDGTNSFIEGTPNKKALYGYISKYNKMIELDVSNYEIDSDGKLSVIDQGVTEPISGNKELNITNPIQLQNYYFDYSFKNSKDELSSLKLALQLNVNGYNSSELLGFSQFQDEIIFASKITRDYGYQLEGGLTINPSFRVISSDNKYSYEIEPTKLDFEFKFVELNDKLSLYPWSYDKPSLYNQSLDTINTLLSRSGSITLENSNLPNDYVQNYLADHLGLEESLIVNGQYYYSSWSNDFTDASVKLQQNKRVDIKCIRRQESDYQYIILLMSFKFNKLAFTITQKSKLENIKENFVKVVKTKKYTDDSIPYKYKVDGKYNKARIRGTSITLNDLEYQSNKDGHRLFVKNSLHDYDSYLRNKIYYRNIEDIYDCHYGNTQYLNNIFLYTGPCFTSDNLN